MGLVLRMMGCAGSVWLLANVGGCKTEDTSGGYQQTIPNVIGFASASAPAPAGTGGAGAAGAGAVSGSPAMNGTAGVTAGAGAAGMLGGAGGGVAGVAGTAGIAAAGTGAAGNGQMVDPTTGLSAAECISVLMAEGTPITACETCLCQPGNCQGALDAMAGDVAADAMLACVRTNNCDAQCCLCGAPCNPLGINYGMGPCVAQIEAAAGVTPGAGALANGATVQMNCAATGPAGNSCADVARLAECVAQKCGSACPQQPPTCM